MHKLSLAVGFSLCVFSLGCGGGGGSNGSSSNGGSSQFTPANIQGQYEAVASSTAAPGSVALIESNFTQTGTNVFASKQNVVLIIGTQSNGTITLTGLGGACDNGVSGNDSLQATFTSSTNLSFTLTEAGSLGTGTTGGTVTFSSDGSQITSGTYNTPAACGFQGDSGTIIGTKIQPFAGAYAGYLSNGVGTDAVIVTVSQSGLNLNVSGTDNGAAFTLTGSVTGATFDVSGTISGQSVQYVGIFDHVNNAFLVYNTSLTYLGKLHTGSTP